MATFPCLARISRLSVAGYCKGFEIKYSNGCNLTGFWGSLALRISPKTYSPLILGF